MSSSNKIACVTGASGMVGSKIVERLISQGYKVRTLSRTIQFHDNNIESFRGGLEDREVLKSLMHGAHLLFHCAAELFDTSCMWDVNVLGTERLLKLARESGIEYLCYLSSAGVIGKTSLLSVNEETLCNPQNTYERTKWEAEKLLSSGVNGCRVIILRPTNVIDEKQIGALAFVAHRSFFNRLKIFIKGGECAHIVHAMDVADAALYLISHETDAPACFFVSCDHERLNTLAGLRSLYRAIENSQPVKGIEPTRHLPIIVPYLLRKLWRGIGNPGTVRYSSEKLLSTGFYYRLGVEGAVRRIVSCRHAII